MLGILQRLGKAVSAVAKKAASALGAGVSGKSSGRAIPGPRLTMPAAAGFSEVSASASRISNTLNELYVGRHYYCKQLDLPSWLPLDDSEEFKRSTKKRTESAASRGPKSRAALIREIREQSRAKHSRNHKRKGQTSAPASVDDARRQEYHEEIDMATTDDPRQVRVHPWVARISPRLHLTIAAGSSADQGSLFGSLLGGSEMIPLADASIPLPTDKIPYVKYSARKAA